MDKYEIAKQNLNALISESQENLKPKNEASTRLHILDRIIFEILGWAKTSITPEDHYDGEYTDYIFHQDGKKLVLEAKKEGLHFSLPSTSTKTSVRLISSLQKDSRHLNDAIEQVARYSQKRGIPYALVSNGHQFIGFVAIRRDIEPFEGKAIVFPSLESVSLNFVDFWNFFSPDGIKAHCLERFLVDAKDDRIPSKPSSLVDDYPGIASRSSLQTDLTILAELVIEDLCKSPEFEEEFLRECYCKSGALSQYAVVSKKLLIEQSKGIAELSPDGLQIEPARTKSGISKDLLGTAASRRPILLLGEVGAGKSSFIHNLVKVEAKEEFKSSITIYIDCGSSGNLTTDLISFVLDAIETQLQTVYSLDIHERNFVRGVYHSEIQRFDRSIYSDLRKSNPDRFREKQIEHLEQYIGNRSEHIRRCLVQIVRGHRRQIILFLDNADQRSESIQQELFLIAQELSENWPATVFLTLRPATFYQSQRSGTMSAYHPKAFHIKSPRVSEVIRKRLQFSQSVCRGERAPEALKNSTEFQSERLETLLSSFSNSIVNNVDLAEFFDNAPGGNVRQALDVVRDFLGSPHVDQERIYKIGREYRIPLHELLRAALLGEGKLYSAESSILTNLLNVRFFDPKEHFLSPLILAFLQNDSSERRTSSGYFSTGLVVDQMQSLGFTPWIQP